MQVQEIMTPRARVINPNTNIAEAAKAMREDNIGALPVGENDRLIGMVTDRDIAMRAVAEERPSGNTAVRQVMSEHVYYCFEDDDIEQAAKVMAEHQVHRLPVLNRDKRLVGMLALADLARSDTDAMKTALAGISEPTDQPRR
jgi:CBS-domain-containing membrane protein